MLKSLMMLSAALCFSAGVMACDDCDKHKHSQTVAYENEPAPYTSDVAFECAAEARCERHCEREMPYHASGYDTSTKPVASYLNDRWQNTSWNDDCCH